MIYLDNSATTRVLDEAAEAASSAMREGFYNPAAAYKSAVRTEKTVNECRKRLAAAMGREADEIVYTSGGTESNNTAILSTVFGYRGKPHIITSMIEHPSVYNVFQMLEAKGLADVTYIGTDAGGAPSMEELKSALRPDTLLVSLMHVNNETGAITDLQTASMLVRRNSPSALIHVDGVQAFCKLPFSRIPCDFYSVSAHKFHAPKGIGALMVGANVKFAGGLIGGGQERNLRSGTTNVPGIVGMDAALSVYRRNHADWLMRMRACKLRLAAGVLQIPDTFVNGPSPEEGAGHILNISFPGVRGEVLLNALSEREIYVSTGSACSAQKKGKNRVLTTMGIRGDRQEGAIRFSFSPFNTLEEMDIVAQQLNEIVPFLRRYKRR